jgi:hypothetical protein
MTSLLVAESIIVDRLEEYFLHELKIALYEMKIAQHEMEIAESLTRRSN